MTLFPGVPRAAVREVRVPADASAVMDWLTDPDRREREIRRQAEDQQDVQVLDIVRLPGGGLRFESVRVRGDQVARHITEDVAIHELSIDRVIRGQATRGHRRSRWIVKQRITVEPLADAVNVTVRTCGRPVGRYLTHHLLGRSDTSTGQFFTQEASRLAGIAVSGVAAHFTSLPGTGR